MVSFGYLRHLFLTQIDRLLGRKRPPWKVTQKDGWERRIRPRATAPQLGGRGRRGEPPRVVLSAMAPELLILSFRVLRLMLQVLEQRIWFPRLTIDNGQIGRLLFVCNMVA